MDYRPIIIEDFGGFHPKTVDFIKKIAQLRAANMNIALNESVKFCFEKISCTLQRANAIALLHHVDIF